MNLSAMSQQSVNDIELSKSTEEKSNKRAIRSKPTLVEKSIGMVKRFRIFLEGDRNGRKRFWLRFTLILRSIMLNDEKSSLCRRSI